MEYFTHKNYLGVSAVLLIVGLIQQLIIALGSACPPILDSIAFSIEYYFVLIALIWIWAVFTVLMCYKECKTCGVKEVKAKKKAKKRK